MDVTLTISSKNKLLKLALYALSFNKTILNVYNNFIDLSVSKKYLSQPLNRSIYTLHILHLFCICDIIFVVSFQSK